MSYKSTNTAVLICISLLLLFPVKMAFAIEDELRVGVFPRRAVDRSIQMFTPLIEHLQKELKRKVILDVPPDMPAFWLRLEQGKYDLVHMNQYHYVRAHAELGWQAILKNEEFGQDSLAAALWVHKDSNIKELSDLKGKLIVFGGGDHAMVASIMTRDMLQQAGITDDSYIGMSTLHPVRSIISVYYRQADAAGVGEPVIQIPQIRKKIDTSKLSILARTEPLAHLPWALSGNIDANTRERIVSSLLMLNDSRQGKKLLKGAGLTGIRAASDKDYDAHRKIIKRVLGEDY